MAPSNIIDILESYIRQLTEEGLPVEGLVLYGSYARGEAKQDSDIDVLVLLKEDMPQNDIAKLWPKLDRATEMIDTRIETWPVSARRFEADQVSPLILAARKDGIRIGLS